MKTLAIAAIGVSLLTMSTVVSAQHDPLPATSVIETPAPITPSVTVIEPPAEPQSVPVTVLPTISQDPPISRDPFGANVRPQEVEPQVNTDPVAAAKVAMARDQARLRRDSRIAERTDDWLDVRRDYELLRRDRQRLRELQRR
jgi:hypothetical protein